MKRNVLITGSNGLLANNLRLVIKKDGLAENNNYFFTIEVFLI